MTRRSATLAALVLGAAVCPGYGGEADADRIRERVEQVKRSENRNWEKIPWVASLLEARRLGKEEKTPIFLFTHDGNMDTGRC